jgi:hypothetical protein
MTYNIVAVIAATVSNPGQADQDGLKFGLGKDACCRRQGLWNEMVVSPRMIAVVSQIFDIATDCLNGCAEQRC